MTAGPRWLYAQSGAAAGRIRAPWRLALYVLSLGAGAVIAQAALYPLILRVAHLATPRPSLENWLALGAALVAHLLCMSWIERRPLADAGLARAGLRPAGLLLGIVLGVAAIGLPSLALLATGELRAEASAPGSWFGTAAALVAFLAPAALWEELMFRGYPLLVLTEAAGAPVALLLTSVVFGVVHAGNPGASPAFLGAVTLAGVFLGAIRFATGSLWVAFAAHLAWNWTLAAALHSAVSGLPFPTPGYRVVDAGPDWLTGGPWGPEGGLAAVAGMLGGLAFLYLNPRFSSFRAALAGRRATSA